MKKISLENFIKKLDKLAKINFSDTAVNDMINYALISLRTLLNNWEKIKK